MAYNTPELVLVGQAVNTVLGEDVKSPVLPYPDFDETYINTKSFGPEANW
jgi:hypothetical protein